MDKLISRINAILKVSVFSGFEISEMKFEIQEKHQEESCQEN